MTSEGPGSGRGCGGPPGLSLSFTDPEATLRLRPQIRVLRSIAGNRMSPPGLPCDPKEEIMFQQEKESGDQKSSPKLGRGAEKGNLQYMEGKGEEAENLPEASREAVGGRDKDWMMGWPENRG